MTALPDVLQTNGSLPAVTVIKGEQSNTSITVGDKAIMKLFRRIEAGVNPNFEIGRFFAQNHAFANSPPLLGAIEYKTNGNDPLTRAVMNTLVPQAETAWQFALDSLGRYFEQLLAQPRDKWPSSAGLSHASLWKLTETPAPQEVQEIADGFLHVAGLLGQRTAEMHLALAAGDESPAFAPETFSQLYQRSLYQSARKLAVQKYPAIKKADRSFVAARARAWTDRA